MKKLLVLLMSLLMVVSLFGCKQEEPEKEMVYSMITNFDVDTLDYVYNNKSSNGDYTSNFIEGLLTQDTHGTLVAGMAEKWEANADSSVWTFTIRKGAKWVTSTGEVYDEVKAEDFVTGLKHAVETNSETLALVSGLIKNLDAYIKGTAKWEDVGIKADGQTLTYTLNQPCGYFDGMTTYSILWPINGEFLAAKGEDYGKVQPDSILYNGCYILKSFVAKQEVKFAKNKKYWDAKNVHVTEVVVTYSDGSDVRQGFDMFTRGEVTQASINSKYEDIVADANKLYPENQYLSMTTATSYWGAFNFDRVSYNLYTDPSVKTTNKTEKQKADTKAAILNKYFRLAIYAAYSTKATQTQSVGEEIALNAARNTLVPYTFATTSDGKSYGALLTEYLEKEEAAFEGINLNDGQDAWYNPERAVAFMQKAVAELGESVEWPIILDHAVDSSNTTTTNIMLAMKKSIEDVLGEYVQINLVYMADRKSYNGTFYSISTGEQNSVDFAFGAGWGPDYGDPLTYIHCFDANEGDMLNYSGLNLTSEVESESGKAAKETIGLYEIQELIDAAAVLSGDERIKAFAQIEAKLLAYGILRPYSTSGANLVVSKVVPFSAAYGLYGQAAYNVVPYFKYMQLQDEVVKAADYYAAKEAWLKGE